MQRLYNALRGSSRLRISGAFPERCCNVMAAAGLPFWEVEREDGEHWLLTVAFGEEGKASELAGRAGCRTERVEVLGFPGFLLGLRRRWGLALGLGLTVLFFALVNQYVLVIDLVGNETLTRSELLAALQGYGFGVGSYGPEVDERDLSNKMLLEFDELGYFSIYLTGCRARVTVRERGPEPQVRDRTAIGDVVAKRDGVIARVTSVRGRPVVQAGEAVAAGETLISHLITHEKRDGSGEIFDTQQVLAQGRVEAYTLYRLSAATPLSVLLPGDTEEQEPVRALSVLGRRLNFSGNGSNMDTGCDKIAILYPARLPGLGELPLGLWEERSAPWGELPGQVAPEGAEAFLKQRLQEKLAALLGEGQVLQATWETERRPGALVVTLEAQCLEDIGRSCLPEETETAEKTG